MEWCNEILRKYMYEEVTWERAQEEKADIEAASTRKQQLAAMKKPAAAEGAPTKDFET